MSGMTPAAIAAIPVLLLLLVERALGLTFIAADTCTQCSTDGLSSALLLALASTTIAVPALLWLGGRTRLTLLAVPIAVVALALHARTAVAVLEGHHPCGESYDECLTELDGGEVSATTRPPSCSRGST
jgi:hypothetical protein